MYDEAQDALAAEYVLGTLSSDEREHAEALRDIDPGFADSVRLWERRLGELNDVMVEAVEHAAGRVGKNQRGDRRCGAAGHDLIDARCNRSTGGRAAIYHRRSAAVCDGRQAFGNARRRYFFRMAFRIRFGFVLRKRSMNRRQIYRKPTLSALPAVRAAQMSAQLTRRVKKWRGVAIAMQAIAALLADGIIAAQFYPNLMPLRGRVGEQQIAQGAAQPASRLVAVLQQDPTSPAFLLTVDPQSRTLVVRRVSAKPEQGRSYELWLVAKGAPAPKSLGLVGQDEFTQRAIPGSFDLATLRSANYAISLEPAGGSTSGVPTGPILFTGNIGRMVATTPHT